MWFLSGEQSVDAAILLGKADIKGSIGRKQRATHKYRFGKAKSFPDDFFHLIPTLRHSKIPFLRNLKHPLQVTIRPHGGYLRIGGCHKYSAVKCNNESLHTAVFPKLQLPLQRSFRVEKIQMLCRDHQTINPILLIMDSIRFLQMLLNLTG